MDPAIIVAKEERAVAAALAVGKRLGLKVEEPKVLASFYSVRVELKPSPVVARVPTWTAALRDPVAPWLAREIAVTRFLAEQGVPVVAPTTEVNPGPHEEDGLSVTLFQKVDVEPGDPAPPAVFGKMLGELHAALRRYRGDLPLMAPPANDIPVAIRLLADEGKVTAGDLSAMELEYERLRPALEAPSGALQPLHGDAHPGNLIRTPSGWVWNDFEDVCRGPIAWDLASLLLSDEAVAAYPAPPSPEERATYQDVRRLHVVTWLLALPMPFEGREDFIESILVRLRTRLAT